MTNSQHPNNSDAGMSPASVASVVDRLALDILHSMHGRNRQMDWQIEALAKDWNNGAAWIRDIALVPPLVISPPGHDEGALIGQAARRVANALDMEYLENGQIDAIDIEEIKANPTKYFVRTSVSIGEGLEVLNTSLSNSRMQKARLAGGSVIALDDFIKASPSVQDVALAISKERRYGSVDMRGSLVAFTADNSRPVSTAMKSGTRPYLTVDSFEDFAARISLKYNDDIGDAATLGFLRRHKECFSTPPDPTHMGGFPSPRSWEKFITQARRAVRASSGNLADAMPEMDDNSAAFLGLEVNQKYVGYMNSYIKAADPVARGAIMNGAFDRKLAVKELAQEAFTGGYFGYQLGQASAHYAVCKIVQERGNLSSALPRFAEAISILDEIDFKIALTTFMRGLDYRTKDIPKRINNGVVFGREIDLAIATAVAEHKDCTENHRAWAIDVLSNQKHSSINPATSPRPEVPKDDELPETDGSFASQLTAQFARQLAAQRQKAASEVQPIDQSSRPK